MANKMTKIDYFTLVAEIIKTAEIKNKEDIVAFLNHEVELLKKKSGSSKSTKTQKVNLSTIAVIKEVLAEQENPVTIGELMEDERLMFYPEEQKDGTIKQRKMTNQKLSSLVRKLLLSEEVIRTENKKKAYFSLAKKEETTEA